MAGGTFQANTQGDFECPLLKIEEEEEDAGGCIVQWWKPNFESLNLPRQRRPWTGNNLFCQIVVFFSYLNFKIILAVVLFTCQRAVPVEYLLKDNPVPSGMQWVGASF